MILEDIISRQPIMTDGHKIIGYEFNFSHEDSFEPAPFERYIKSCARVLTGPVGEKGTQWLMGDKLAFINVNEAAFLSDVIELMPAKHTIIELLHSVNPTDEVITRCVELKMRGYKIAIENPSLNTTYVDLIRQACYIKIDIAHIKNDDDKKLLTQFYANKSQVIVENLTSMVEFDDCRANDIKLFQGFYFLSFNHDEVKSSQSSFESLFNILNKLSQDASNKEIEGDFKVDAALTFKLLRYINSVGFGLSCEIMSINHALTILGRKKLYRWLTLLLITSGKNKAASALIKTSVTRGRMAELIGESYFDASERDNLFILGVFSLLDAILGMKMEDIVDKINLQESIEEALLGRRGVYGPFLQLSEAVEKNDRKKIIELCDALSIDANMVNERHMSALTWVEAQGF